MQNETKFPDIERLSPGGLVPYGRNSRTHSPEQIEQIVASIKEFGFTNPILIAEDSTIIAGHGRVQAAVAMGMDVVPCLRIAGLTDEQRRAYIIADNKLAENAGWDDELLRLELGELRDLGYDIDVVGFDQAELDELFLETDGLEEEGKTDDDEIPAFGDWFTSCRGDVWVCGDHRIMCGDSTVITDIETLVGEGGVDMCWTDPPYNVNYEGAAGKIENDNMEASAFLAFLTDAFVSVFSVLKAGGALYVAHADTEGLPFRTAFASAGFKLSGCLVWVKPSLVLGRSDYQWRHEPILYGWKPGAAHRWYGGRKQTTVIDAEDMPFVITPDGSLLIDTGPGTIRVSGTDLKVEELVSSVLRHEKPRRNVEHPTMKPVGLVLEYLKNSSRRGDLVLDPFGGSGSTMIAAQKIGRRSRLMELDPRFADVIVRRWQDFTGGKAVLEESGERFDDLTAQRKAAQSEQG
jgi:DNA modification methylase